MKRLIFPFWLILFSGTWSLAFLNAQPNIIVLFCDDLGYGDLACYGHPSIRTPQLDRMASEGMRFTQFYAASPACSASRYGLLTGRLPIRSGFEWVLYPQSERGLHPEEVTLAEALRKAGYATACFGKWHLGNTQPGFLPLQQGFDEYHGLPYSNDMLPPNWAPIPLMEGNDTLMSQPDQHLLTGAYTDRAINFIEKNKARPFFLYLPYAMPHVPLHPGPAYAGQSPRGMYGDVVEEIDGSVGKILSVLKAEGLAENTLVIFTSDNGPWIIRGRQGGSAGLLRDGKGSSWEGGQREPCIAWWPGNIPAGSVCRQPASTLDIFPTALSLTGQPLPNGRSLDGSDLSDLILGRKDSLPERLFFYYGPGNHLDAVRMGPWKLHVRTTSQTGIDYFEGKLPLLFHLEQDPSEQYDLSEHYPEVVIRLQQAIAQHQQSVESEGTFWDQ